MPFSVKREFGGDFENKIIEKRPQGWVGGGVKRKFEIGKALTEILNESCDYVFKKDKNALEGTVVFELLDVDINYIGHAHPRDNWDMNCKLAIKWMLKDKNNAIIDGKTVFANETGTIKRLDNSNAPTNVAIEKIANKFILQVSSSQKIQDFVEKQKILADGREKKQFLTPKPTTSTASELVVGKVTSLRGDVAELDIGAVQGAKVGDSGRILYKVTIDGKEKPVYLARFRITHTSERSCMARIEETTGEVRVGHTVEIKPEREEATKDK